MNFLISLICWFIKSLNDPPITWSHIHDRLILLWCSLVSLSLIAITISNNLSTTDYFFSDTNSESNHSVCLGTFADTGNLSSNGLTHTLLHWAPRRFSFSTHFSHIAFGRSMQSSLLFSAPEVSSQWWGQVLALLGCRSRGNWGLRCPCQSS